MAAAALAASAADPMGPWSDGVAVRPVSAAPGRHSIHSYFNVSPESPDGRFVVFFSSATPDGEHGEVRILERATGKERVLARNVTTEDAHRAACQQWLAGGRYVVFHDVRKDPTHPDGERWVVVAVDVRSGKERILVSDRQVAWGLPDMDEVPVYGKHWAPGPHRDLEMVNVHSGAVRKVVLADAVRKTYPELVAKVFKDRPISIFFPILAPGGERLLFKIASAGEPNYRSPKASHRDLLICYDLKTSRFLCGVGFWGHPAWHPDGRRILNVPGKMLDSETGVATPVPGYARLSGAHPSVAPSGRLYVSDSKAERFGGKPGEWCIVVGELGSDKHRVLHTFDNSQGARSWRVAHPHPVFGPDGKRIYFNVSDGQFTRLFVAESGTGSGKVTQ